ncbi:MAG: PaaX family transcriptional regulator [Actinomycetota bacterium]|nr:PaaX family transcriptional regulator [Actinomycetota bacterium]
MRARSALFDLYGDHLRGRGGWAPVSALVRLLEPLGVAAPAVRTAISRMVSQGWLDAQNVDGAPGYALTERAGLWLDDAARRIYRTSSTEWDGSWRVLVLDAVPDRPRRERVRNQLRYLGYAPLSDSTWVSPRKIDPGALLAEESVGSVRFTCADPAPVAALVDAFEPEALGAAYQQWLSEARTQVEAHPDGSEQDAFAVRSTLVHEWRKFLFRDPGLPAVLLPPQWPGLEAAAFFDRETARLLPPARRFIDECLHSQGDHL